MTAATSTSVAAELVTDPALFAERLLGRRLFDYQAEVARHPARYRVLCSGRQSGKSALLACLALHTAVTRRDALVLVVSAGEEAAKRLLADVADLARERLSGSVVDDSKSVVVLSNRSEIRSVPASERQVRGWSADLLIVDEAAWIPNDLWQAAEPTIIARPGSRVIIASSPGGPPMHWYRRRWQAGMDAPSSELASWHWPCTVNPLVSAAVLESIRQHTAPDVFAVEYLAEWADAEGAYFTDELIANATADYALTPPEEMPFGRFPVAAGVDWSAGVGRDSHALTLVGRMANAPGGKARLFVAHHEAHSRQPFDQFIDRVVESAGGYWVRVAASERNGVGEFPTSELERRLRAARSRTRVAAVWTDARHKLSGFSRMKGLMQSGRLVLPVVPELLREMRALRYEVTQSGSTRIEVPTAGGLHDDRVMSLMQALTCIEPHFLRDVDPWGRPAAAKTVKAGAGFEVPARPMPDPAHVMHLTVPDAEDKGDGW